jgi:hypothetical protein
MFATIALPHFWKNSLGKHTSLKWSAQVQQGEAIDCHAQE